MIDFFWKLVAYWTLYETLRFIIIYLVREEIGKIAGIKIRCHRCQWRIFCAKASVYLWTRVPKSVQRREKIGVYILLLGMFIGNGDAIWIILRKLVEERKAINVRQKSVVSR